MNTFKKITTQYSETEDRIMLSGEVSSDESVTLWINQRLLIRLLPHFFSWLEKQDTSSIPKEISQNFAQQAAKAELTPDSPVTANEQSKECLIVAVDVTPVNGALKLVFRSKDNHETHLVLPGIVLRQWLSILYSLWHTAEWPTDIWPEWMQSTTSEEMGELTEIFH